MPFFVPIYGLQITKPIDLPGLRIYPRSSEPEVAKHWAEAPFVFHLTAVAEYQEQKSDSEEERLVYNLSGAITFLEQRWVKLSMPTKFPQGTPINDVFEGMSLERPSLRRRASPGPLIIEDHIEPTARTRFLKKCLAALEDQQFEDTTGFRSALFRNVESRRVASELVDLTYYLDFSALELMARVADGYSNGTGESDAKAPPLLKSFLNDHGFNFTENNQGDRKKAAITYTHLRNALFHKGSFIKEVNDNGTMVVLRLLDYEEYLRLLVPLVILKVLNYSDSTINWDRWHDRMPFCCPIG